MPTSFNFGCPCREPCFTCKPKASTNHFSETSLVVEAARTGNVTVTDPHKLVQSVFLSKLSDQTSCLAKMLIREFLKIRVPYFGVLVIRILIRAETTINR